MLIPDTILPNFWLLWYFSRGDQCVIDDDDEDDEDDDNDEIRL